MLFKRRTPPTWSENLRVWLWPRRSWMRSTQYVTKRILRLTATPHAIAAGVAAGVFTSFTPFMGLHFIVAFAFAWFLRGNLIAAALGTFFGNPLTFPLIWTATFNTGNWILGLEPAGSGVGILASSMAEIVGATFTMDFHEAIIGVRDIWHPLLYPMLIGGMILGTLFAIPFYLVTRRATAIFREKRRDQLLKKAAAMHEKATQLDNSRMPSGARS